MDGVYMYVWVGWTRCTCTCGVAGVRGRGQGPAGSKRAVGREGIQPAQPCVIRLLPLFIIHTDSFSSRGWPQTASNGSLYSYGRVYGGVVCEGEAEEGKRERDIEIA